MFSFYLASILALSQLACAGFGASSQSNIAVYWGQNSYGQATSQQRLSTYCSNTKFNIIPLAFLTGISTPTTNFANAGNNCTVYSGTNLWDCPQLEEDIKTCQNTYSKTILLSLGGSTYAEGGFDSSATAKTNATNIWNLFGPNTTFANRPFGTAVVDGFDFDFEATTKNTAPFAQQLRDLMTSATGKTYYLAAAPQCPYPDTATNDILTNVSLDFVMVQFYNNYCGASSYTQGTTTQANFNFKTWDTWAKGSKNANVKVFLGVPASSGAAGSGYVNATGLASVINYCKTFTSFGGVMMWDMSQMVANTGFLDGVYSALATSTTSTASTTSTTSTSKTSTSTTLITLTTSTSKTSTSTSSLKTSTTSSPTPSSTTTTTSSTKPSTTSTSSKTSTTTTSSKTSTTTTSSKTSTTSSKATTTTRHR
ncbi:putative Glycoside hydrolase superfamily [Seiridium cardinale]|uniref:chitinase n=1 Tax=Seiridium cardinale TaxID=138064 RepID=A0ABR2XH86_9PEZI